MEEEQKGEVREKCSSGIDISDKKDFYDPSLPPQYRLALFPKPKLSSTQKYRQWLYCHEYLNFFTPTSIASINPNKLFSHESQLKNRMQQLYRLIKAQNFVIMNNTKDFLTQSPNQILVKITSNTKYFNVIEILCQLGPFAKGYTVLNEPKQSPRHANKLLSYGGFGRVYCCQSQKNHNQTVVKCLEFNQKTQCNLRHYIKQFFICDLMSSLQTGPKFIRSKGFDFILFQNCLQFQMQKCTPYHDEKVESEIKQSLLRMHMLKVVHCDIKTSNIMYSRCYGKNVLIDFGVSDIINQEWGEKTLVSFRGTYEYCGQEMKEIFMIKETKQVDLYRNDVEQLVNTLKCVSFDVKDAVAYEKEKENRKNLIPFELSRFIVEQNETIFLLKYHFYFNQDRRVPQRISEIFFEQVERIKDEDILAETLSQCIRFVLHLQKLSLSHLYSHLINKCPRMQYINTSVKEISLEDLAKMDAAQIESNFIEKGHSERMKKIYVELGRNKTNRDGQREQEQVQYEFTDKHSVTWLLDTPTMFIKLSQQQKYELFLTYCSFWKPSFSTSIHQKQSFAQKFASLIHLNNQKLHLQYYQPQYLPELQFVKILCPNIVLVYSLLLTQCMQEGFDAFKQKFMPLILKDCIVLGFQYYLFFADFMSFYYKGLVNQQNPSLISLMIIETCELHFLTINHFLWTTSHEPYFQHKLKKYCLKQNLHQTISYLKQTVPSSQPYYRKLKPLQAFWTTLMGMKRLMNEPHMYLNNQKPQIETIIDQICFEFSCLNILEGSHAFNLSIAYIYKILLGSDPKSYDANVQIKIYEERIVASVGFSLNVLISPLIVYECFEVKDNLIKFDDKIHCNQLSEMFCLQLRYRTAQTYNDKKQIKRILELITTFPGCPSYNHSSIQRVIPSFNFIQKVFSQIPSQRQYLPIYKQTLNKLHSIHRKLVSFFKEDSYFLNFCLIYWDNLNKNNGSKQLDTEPYHAENVQFIEAILDHTVSEASQICTLNLLVNIYDWYSLEYLTACRKFFYLCKSHLFSDALAQNHRVVSLQKQVIHFYFSAHLFRCYLMHDQFITYWENFIIKKVLGKALTVLNEFKKLCNAFIMKKLPKYIAQILTVVCSERDIIKDGIAYFNGFFSHLEIVISHKQLLSQLYSELIKYVEAFKQKLPEPINILPLYCFILSLQPHVHKDSGLWKKNQIEAYTTFDWTAQIKGLKKEILCAYRMKIHRYVLDYLKAHNEQKRNKLFLLRQVGKNFSQVIPNLLNGIEQYQFMHKQMINLINQMQREISISKQQQSKTKKLKLKFQQYLANLSLNFKELKNPYILNEKMKINYQTPKRNLIEDHQLQMQYMQQFSLKDLNLSKRQNLTSKYITLVQIKPLLQEQQFADKLKNIRHQVQRLKSTPQNAISQQIYRVIDETLKEEKRMLAEELKIRKQIRMEELNKWPEKYIFQGKSASIPKQVTLMLSVV